jgi:hypothetical protein
MAEAAIVYPLTAAADGRVVPCGHMIEPVAERCDEVPTCELGHDLSDAHCGAACGDYLPGLNQTERTRCEVWTRVMGYHRPVSAFNAGKAAEHADRRYFRERADVALLEGAGHD